MCASIRRCCTRRRRRSASQPPTPAAAHAHRQLRRRCDEVRGRLFARLGGLEHRRVGDAAAVQGWPVGAPAPRGGGRGAGSRGQLPATVLTAFQNVSDTLYALQGDADALAAQTAAERSAAGSLDLVQAQYKAGGASYLQVLTAEQTYQNAAIALVKARAQRYADTAALFQALGGGWWNRADIDRQFNRLTLRIAASTMEPVASPRMASPSRSSAMIKPLVIMLLARGRRARRSLRLAGIHRLDDQEIHGAARRRAPQTVSTVTAAATTWQAQIHAVGTLRAVRGADLSAASIRGGRRNRVRIRQRGARRASCCCGSSRTMTSPNCSSCRRPRNSPRRLTSAIRSNSRRRPSVRRPSTRDVSTLKSARAQVAAQQALIEEKIVRAPFAGRLGIRQVDLGQYLTRRHDRRHAAGARSDPDRFLRAAAGAQGLKIGQAATATVDTYPGVSFSGRHRIDQLQSRHREPQRAGARLLP